MAKQVNKVIFGGQTIMDVSDATASQDDIALGTSAYLGDGTRGSGRMVPLLYCTCETNSSTAQKVATIVDRTTFLLAEGARVLVKFTNSNTAANPTLNVNDTGAILIKKYGVTPAGTEASTSWNSGSIVLLVYDGTNWIMLSSWDNDTTYSSKPEASGGQDVSLVTTGDKYNWNRKISLSDNIQDDGFDFGGNIKHISITANGDGLGFQIRCYLKNGISVRLHFDAVQGLFQYFDTEWHTTHKFY